MKQKKRSAADVEARSTKNCDAAPGRVIPIIRRDLCDGERDCVVVCPYDVFQVRRLTFAEWRAVPRLSLRLALPLFGNRQAFTVDADACRACGLCVRACPHRAVELVRPG